MIELSQMYQTLSCCLGFGDPSMFMKENLKEILEGGKKINGNFNQN